jgi:hypothetical protein
MPTDMAPTPELFTALASFQPTLSAKIYDGSCLWLVFWLPLKLGGHHIYQCNCLGTSALSRNEKGVLSVLNYLCLLTRLKALSFVTLQCEKLLDKIGTFPELLAVIHTPCTPLLCSCHHSCHPPITSGVPIRLQQYLDRVGVYES